MKINITYKPSPPIVTSPFLLSNLPKKRDKIVRCKIETKDDIWDVMDKLFRLKSIPYPNPFNDKYHFLTAVLHYRKISDEKKTKIMIASLDKNIDLYSLMLIAILND